jgi:hypothetical protein
MEDSALVPANYSELPREANKTNDSTFDRIYKYYFKKQTRIELTTEEQRICDRWEKAWLLSCRHRTTKQVADLLERLYCIKKSVAYDDVRFAMMLFGNPKEDLKEAKRAIAEDGFLKGADRAWKKGNLEMHLKYMKEYAEINTLKSAGQTEEMADIIKKLKPTQIVIVSTPLELEALANKMQEELTRDTEFSIESE